MAKIIVSRFLKRQLAAILIDLMDGDIDDKVVTVNVLRALADEIEQN